MTRLPFFAATAAALVVCFPTAVRAQPAPPAPNDAAPPARTGFQLALRTGYMVPFGQATGAPGDTMGNTFSGQVPLIVDIGWKPWPTISFSAATWASDSAAPRDRRLRHAARTTSAA